MRKFFSILAIVAGVGVWSIPTQAESSKQNSFEMFIEALEQRHAVPNENERGMGGVFFAYPRDSLYYVEVTYNYENDSSSVIFTITDESPESTLTLYDDNANGTLDRVVSNKPGYVMTLSSAQFIYEDEIEYATFILNYINKQDNESRQE